MQLGMGLAVAQNKTAFDFGIYELLKKVGRDLLPAARLKILMWLYENEVFEHLKERRKTREIADEVNLPGSTTKMLLEDMMLIGILNRDMDGGAEKAAYEWQIADETVDIIKQESRSFQGKLQCAVLGYHMVELRLIRVSLTQEI